MFNQSISSGYKLLRTITTLTRMHSSRMHTSQSLTVFRGLLFLGGGCMCRGVYLPEGGVPARGGGVPTRRVYLPEGVPAQEGCTWQGGVPAKGECTCQREGVYLPEGGVPARGVYLPGVYLPRGSVPAKGRGCTCQRVGVPAEGYLPGGVPAKGVYLPEGGCTCHRGVYLPGPGGVWSGTPPLLTE